MPDEWIVESEQLTHTGQKRQHNDDYVGYFEPDNLDELKTNGRLYLVADGVGGAASGEIASEFVVKKILYDFYTSNEPNLKSRLLEAIEAANADIFERNNRFAEDREMATTLVAALLNGTKLLVANIGDSRAYVVRDEQIKQISQDHSFVEQLVREGSISADEAKNHPARNRILRSLGIDEHPKIDTFTHQLTPGDIIVLCTDGLTRHVVDNEIAQLVTKYSPEKAVQQLVELANVRGGKDNISVSITRILPEPVQNTIRTKTGPLTPPDKASLTARQQPQKAAPRRLYPNRTRQLIFFASALFIVGLTVVGGAILLWFSGITGKTSPNLPETVPTVTVATFVTETPIIATKSPVNIVSAVPSPTSAPITLATIAPLDMPVTERELRSPGVIYDFVQNAPSASWSAGQGIVTPVFSEIDGRLQIPAGAIVALGKSEISVGNVSSNNVLLTHPSLEDGTIQGTYDITTPLQPTDFISATLGFPAWVLQNDDGVTFEVIFRPEAGAGPPETILLQRTVYASENLISLMEPLSAIQPGQIGTITLQVKSGASKSFDWALWINLLLIRPQS